MNAQARAIIAFLKNTGAGDINIENGGKHPRIRYTWEGCSRFYVIPGTPGDARRGTQQALSDLRRLMGLTNTEKRIGERRTHRKRAARPGVQLPETITVPLDPMVGLWKHPHVVARLPAMLDGALLAYWQACLRSVGGRSILTSYGSFNARR